MTDATAPPPATLLIVDDEPANLAALNAALQPHYRVRAARSGAEALRAAAAPPRPDLILMDVVMPESGGYEALAELRKTPAGRDIPVIFVTSMDDAESEKRGLELGAVDYIAKPINPAIVLARVRTHLELKAARDRLAGQNLQLEALVAERTRALEAALKDAEASHAALRKTYFGTLMAISALIDLRGVSIGSHSRRVADMSRQLAHDLGMSAEDAQDVFVAALLHDIGRVGFSDSMLDKPVASLNAEEFAGYRRHPKLGADALARIPELANIAAMVRHHHEHFDGTGYPEGRSGLDIPLGARIIAAVSDFDDYRHGGYSTTSMSMKECHRHLVEGRGHRYDPTVVDRFEALLDFDERDEVDDIRVTPTHLQERMMVSRDVMHPDGFLLLSKSTVLTRRVIEELVKAERACGRSFEIYVMRERAGS